jgi:hypothetical protein
MASGAALLDCPVILLYAVCLYISLLYSVPVVRISAIVIDCKCPYSCVVPTEAYEDVQRTVGLLKRAVALSVVLPII